MARKKTTAVVRAERQAGKQAVAERARADEQAKEAEKLERLSEAETKLRAHWDKADEHQARAVELARPERQLAHREMVEVMRWLIRIHDEGWHTLHEGVKTWTDYAAFLGRSLPDLNHLLVEGRALVALVDHGHEDLPEKRQVQRALSRLRDPDVIDVAWRAWKEEHPGQPEPTGEVMNAFVEQRHPELREQREQRSHNRSVFGPRANRKGGAAATGVEGERSDEEREGLVARELAELPRDMSNYLRTRNRTNLDPLAHFFRTQWDQDLFDHLVERVRTRLPEEPP